MYNDHQKPTPTKEQLAALDMAKTGQSFKIVAYAGAGKTTTLKLISENLRGRGLYLAFNKPLLMMHKINSRPTFVAKLFIRWLFAMSAVM